MLYAYLVLALSLQFGFDSPHVPARVKVSEEVSVQRLTKKVDPKYPAPAIAACIQGDVSLLLIVGPDGSVRSAKILRGPVELREAARTAVLQWEYAPYFLNGKPVEQETTASVRFRVPPTLCLPGKS